MEFKTPDRIIMGDDIVAQLQPGFFSEYGKRALVVTGPRVGKTTMMRTLLDTLMRDEVSVTVYDGVSSEPTVAMVETGVKIYKEAGCDFVVGLGGGSPLDTCKAIAAMSVNEGDIAKYVGREIRGNLPPVICVPTTAGTGSEATKYTIITDENTGVKMLLKGEALLPRVAIVDYTFGQAAPAGVVASSGLDAMTHAIEAYLSVKAQPLTDVLALNAMRKILRFLPEAYKNPGNKRARKEMAVAALEAGICINNSSVTVIHGMSRPLGAHYHLPHGMSNAILLMTCLRDLYADAEEKFEKIARHFKLLDGMMFLDQLDELVRKCDVPRLRDFGVDKQEFMDMLPKLAADAIASGSPGNAPKEYTEQEIIKLYTRIY